MRAAHGSGPPSAHCCARSWDDLELVAWQAHVLQCHSPGGTKPERCAKGNVLSGMLCMCWKCPERTRLRPLQRQSHNCCLKRKALSPGHLDSCSDEQPLSFQIPGRALLHTARLPQACAQPVPSLCPCSPCAHQHELCRSLLSLTAPPFLSCAYIVQTLPSDEGAPLWWSLSHPTPVRWWCSPELLVNAGLQGHPGMSIWHGSACPPCSADTSPQCKPVLPAW